MGYVRADHVCLGLVMVLAALSCVCLCSRKCLCLYDRKGLVVRENSRSSETCEDSDMFKGNVNMGGRQHQREVL